MFPNLHDETSRLTQCLKHHSLSAHRRIMRQPSASTGMGPFLCMVLYFIFRSQASPHSRTLFPGLLSLSFNRSLSLGGSASCLLFPQSQCQSKVSDSVVLQTCGIRRPARVSEPIQKLHEGLGCAGKKAKVKGFAGKKVDDRASMHWDKTKKRKRGKLSCDVVRRIADARYFPCRSCLWLL